MKTHVGVDLHQRFCYLTAVDASGKLLRQGQVANQAAALQDWLGSLERPRQVVVEASGFWPAFHRAAGPEAERLVMVHPQRVKAIASAKLKNDRVDAATLAHLSRCDLLPEAWIADEATQQLRLRVRLRINLGRQRARAKNQLQAVLHQEGFIKPVTDLFGRRGRAWLQSIELSAAGRQVVQTWLREVDHLDAEIALRTRELERMAAGDVRARWLQTVPGIGAYSAMVMLAEIGDTARFASEQALGSYAGLVPVVRESAGKRQRGSIMHHGSNTLRWIMLQVAQVACRYSPAVRAWYTQLRRRRAAQVARIAVARKLLYAAWAMLRDGVCFDEQVFARR
ncbi:MAG: IS110 family transposase [Acidobacteriaceae bacterium]